MWGTMQDIEMRSQKITIDKSKQIKLRNSKLEKFIELNPTQILLNTKQPRKYFDEKKIQQLAKSIAKEGLLQPVLVRKDVAEGKYLLVAGERRLRALRSLHADSIPALILNEETEEGLLRAALIENIQRQDLSALEEAVAYRDLIAYLCCSHAECAQQLGIERVTVTNSLRILTLPKLIQDDLATNTLSKGHGLALLSLKVADDMLLVRDRIIKEGLSVRATEKICRKYKKNSNTRELKSQDEYNPAMERVAERVRSKLKTRVRLSGSTQKGKIEISYFSLAQLEKIISTLGC
jgi:ParB family transcriptional regulator, chromosome partitioning protein